MGTTKARRDNRKKKAVGQQSKPHSFPLSLSLSISFSPHISRREDKGAMRIPPNALNSFVIDENAFSSGRRV